MAKVNSSAFAITRGFIMPNGDIVRDKDSIKKHEDIAWEYIQRNNLLRLRYEKMPKGYSATDFLVLEMGALKIGKYRDKPNVITFKESWYTPKEFWYYIEYYQSQGFRIDKL